MSCMVVGILLRSLMLPREGSFAILCSSLAKVTLLAELSLSALSFTGPGAGFILSFSTSALASSNPRVSIAFSLAIPYSLASIATLFSKGVLSSCPT